MDDRQQERRLAATLVILLAAIVVGILLWMALANYLSPTTAEQRKDLVNMFVLSAAGLVGSLTASAAVGTYLISRSNLQQQRELDERHAQDDALQAYFEQMGKLLAERKLMQTRPGDPLRSLATAQTGTVLRQIDTNRKKELVLFLYGAGLLNNRNTIVSLIEADLSGVELSDVEVEEVGDLVVPATLADSPYTSGSMAKVDRREINLSGTYLNDAKLNFVILSEANLSHAYLDRADLRGGTLDEANLSGANLNEAKLKFANLMGANLEGAHLNRTDLVRADLNSADLSWVHLTNADMSRARLVNANLTMSTLDRAKLDGADLTGANLSECAVTEEQLAKCKSLEGAIMPDGTKHP